MMKLLPKRVSFCFLFLSILLKISNVVAQTTSNPDGFEDGTIVDWTGGSGTETAAINSSTARTGQSSLALTTTSTGGGKYWYSHAPYANTPSGTYVHFIYWAQSSVAGTSVDASMRFSSSNPPTGTGTTANATATPITNSSWTRVSFGGVGNNASRYYFAAPRRTTSNAATIFIDDLIIYTSNSTTTDLTDPTAATNPAGTVCGGLSWTNGTDAGTGVQSTLIFKRSAGTSGSNDLTLNNQSQYSLTSTIGPSVVGNWTLVEAGLSSVSTTYTGGVFNIGDEYAIVHRDLAYNYSLPTYVVLNICGPNTPPIINPQSFSVDENSPNGTLVGTVVATDVDVTQTLTYSIISGNNDAFFAISNIGTITVAGPIDYENKSSYTLGIQVSDNGSPVESASAIVSININDLNNENAPVVSDQMYSVDENVSLGTVVGTMAATDADGNALSYSITAGNAGNVFAINSSTGEITVSGLLNYETKLSYYITVKVSDNGAPTRSSTANVIVTINNLDENPNAPVIDDLGGTWVDENSSIGTLVYDYNATDADANQTLTYSIVSGNIGNAFSINSVTGELRVNGSLDFETTFAYNLTIEVRDNGEPVKKDDTFIGIKINDINENPNSPVVSNQVFSVFESSSIGTTVGQVTASDADAGQTLSYAITAGNPGNVFAINPNGVITVAGVLDYEAISSYTLTVKVIDNGTPSKFATGTVIINVLDVLETGVGDATFSAGIKMYPNPAKNIISIESDKMNLSGAQVKILSAYGVLVFESAYDHNLNLSDLNSGVYSVVILHAGKTAVQKLVIE